MQTNTSAASALAAGAEPTQSEALRDASGHISAGWKTAFASMVGLAIGPSTIMVFCYGIFIPGLEKEFGWSIGAISFGATLLSLTLIFTGMFAGYCVDRIGVRRLALWSMPFFGASVASLSLLKGSIPTFYASLVLVMVIGTGVGTVVYNKATAVWFDRRLGLSLGLANAGIGIGAALLPALAGALMPLYGWRVAYVVLGILAVAIPWPVAYWMLKDRPAGTVRAASGQGAGDAPAARMEGMAFEEAVRTWDFWITVAGFAILGCASSTFVIHLVRILVDAGMAPGKAAYLQTVMGVSLIFGRIATGWILDRMKASTVMTWLCLVAAVALVGLGMGAPYSTAALCAGMGGFVIGAEFDVLSFLIARYFGRRAFGTIYGALFALFQVASAASVGLLGWWRSSQGSYALGLFLIAGALLAGALLFVRLGPYRYPPAA